MPAWGAPVTLYGLISTMYVNRDQCVNTAWDPDWQSLVDQGYFLVYDPPIPCVNVRALDNGPTSLNSPLFTGDPNAPTPTFGDNDTSVATTAFVQAAILAAVGGTALIEDQILNGETAKAPSQNAVFDALAGKVSKTGDTINGNLTLSTDGGTTSLVVDSDPGQIALLSFRSNSLSRWGIFKSTTTESGGNAGSPLVIRSYDDSGATLLDALTFSRASGAATFGGDVTVSRGANPATFAVSSDAGNTADMTFRSAASTRWIIRKSNTAESGSNAGSNLEIRAYNDAGTLLSTPIAITRSTGNISLSGSLAVGNGTNTSGVTTTVSATANNAFVAQTTGETGYRLGISGAGTLTWGNGSGVYDVNLFRAGADVLRTNDAVNSERSAVGEPAFYAHVSGDTVSRILVQADGNIQWGSGSASRDVNLYRSAADILKTDDAFQSAVGFSRISANAATAFHAYATNATDYLLGGRLAAGDTQDRFAINIGGSLLWGSGGGAADTTLYRFSANNLGTDDCLVFTRTATDQVLFTRVSGAANPHWQTRVDGRMDWGAGGASAVDTALYRDGAASLRTDGTFRSTALTISNTAAAVSGNINADAGQTARLMLMSGFLSRWAIRKTETAESGSDAGSNFVIEAFNDAGTSSGNALIIIRSSRQVQLTATAPRIFSAATGSRPTASGSGAGAHMFDTTLGKPIWSNGTNWVDATGATV